MQAAFSTVFGMQEHTTGQPHGGTEGKRHVADFRWDLYLWTSAQWRLKFHVLFFKRDFKIYTFIENISGIDLVGHTIQFNNLNNVFSRHNRKWASLFLWNKFKCSGMNLGGNLRVLGLHQLRTTALQYTECTASTQAVDVRRWRGWPTCQR